MSSQSWEAKDGMEDTIEADDDRTIADLGRRLLIPFALSLSKGNPRIFKGFDRLSPNGFK